MADTTRFGAMRLAVVTRNEVTLEWQRDANPGAKQHFGVAEGGELGRAFG